MGNSEAAEAQVNSAPATCTVGQLVQELGGEDVISKMTIYRLVRDGDLSAIRATERKILILRSSIAEWIERSRVPAQDGATPAPRGGSPVPGSRAAGEEVA